MKDEQLNKLVLERAQKQVEERKAAMRLIVEQPRQPLPEHTDRSGLWAFIALLLTLMLGTLLLLPGTFAERLSWVVHGVCAKEHTLVLGGVTLPLCQRNTGIYSGSLATLLTLIALGRGRAGKLPSRFIMALLVANVAWMAVDGFNSLLLDIGSFNLYTPQPVLRILSGLAAGMTIGTLLLFAFNITMRANVQRDQRVIQSWRDVGMVALVEVLLFVLIRLAGPVIAYPLAIFSTIGILLVMFTVNVLVVGMISRYEGAVTRIVQLARPAMVALVLTVLEFGLLAWGRVVMEQRMGL